MEAEVADAEEDLPGEKVREQGRGRGEEGVVGEEGADVVPEGAGEEMVVVVVGIMGGAGGGHGGRRREGEEVEEISRDTSLHSLVGTGVNDHSWKAEERKRRRRLELEREKSGEGGGEIAVQGFFCPLRFGFFSLVLVNSEPKKREESRFN